MNSFFRSFFAAILALAIFTIAIFFILMAYVTGIASKQSTRIEANSVLVLDLSNHFAEQARDNPLSLLDRSQEDMPGLYDVIRLLQKARIDKDVAGIYIIANGNANGFAASTELRHALLDFKASGKFILAHGDVISQRAYSVANVADKIYVSPQGSVEWLGFSVQYAFFKGALEKLDIEPQIFYAGKFKSATEPFRTDKMTPENQLQTSVWLGDLYNDFLLGTSTARNIDTGNLHEMANKGLIRTAEDAVNNKLVDGVKYDDEIKDEIKSRLKIDKFERINFVTFGHYYSLNTTLHGGGDRIALIYAEGDIVDGRGGQGTIGSETYRDLIRKARLDKAIKAIVFRVNSGGGSSLASENIWRELSLAKKEKPVVVSFGDVAASGGYYISCAADSIFALPTTITGSIGVFGIVPNMQAFFKNKLGVTFDGVNTGPYADALTITKPMNANEKQMIQADIETVYSEFKQRVAEGRKKDTIYVDSIGQGRVWTGIRAKDLGLIDRFGGIDDAVKCAARLAKLNTYRLMEFPETSGLLDRLLGNKSTLSYESKVKEDIGEENYRLYMQVKKIKEMANRAQTKLPFEFTFR